MDSRRYMKPDTDLDEIKNMTAVLQIQNELLQKKKLFASLGAKLPDGGARLKKDIEKLEIKLKDLELIIRTEGLDSCGEGNPRESGKSTETLDATIQSICSDVGSISLTKSKSSGELGNDKLSRGTDKGMNKLDREFVKKGIGKHHHAAGSHDQKHTRPRSPVYPQDKHLPCKSIEPLLENQTIKCGEHFAKSVAVVTVGDGESSPVTESTRGLNNDSYRDTKQKNFLTYANITLKKKENLAPKHNKTQAVTRVAGVQKDIEIVPSNTTKQNLTFSDLRKEYESRTPETAKLDDIKRGSWKDWRDQNVRQIKLTEAQPHGDPESCSLKGNWLGTLSAGHKNRIKSEEVARIHAVLKGCPPEDSEEDDPEGLKTKLMGHQRQALAWLVWREKQTPSGGIFADDMGLGKTLTMLSLVLKQKNSSKVDQTVVGECGATSCRSTLIVCLSSIMHQWNAEVEKHCQSKLLNVLVYHGKGREKNLVNICDYDLVITTYGIILSEGKSITSGTRNVPLLFQIHWERIILDEAHMIKNEKSATSKCVCILKGSHKWAVTGTPIHNDVKDLYSLLKFLQYSPFDDYKVWKGFVADDGKKSIERRNTLVRSILFRRSKEQCDEAGKPLVQLPKKHLVCHKLKLSEAERKIYDVLYNKTKARMVSYLKNGDGGGGDGCCVDPGGQNHLVLILRLQQCCNHISLLKQSIEDDVSLNDSDVSSLSDSIASMSIGGDKSPKKPSPDISFDLNLPEDNFAVSAASTKIKALFKELKKIENTDKSQKSVIVSQWVSMLEIVEYHLKEHHITYTIIRGNTKPEDRMEASAEFNENPDGPRVMLLSLKAGGVGLNLIGGNHLFLLDHHWNPALESQACDRIYRVGQVRDVFIHKFLCTSTIETTIAQLQDEKSNVAKSTLEGGKKIPTRVSFDDLKLLFGIH